MSAIDMLIERHESQAEQEARDRKTRVERRYRETLEEAEQAFYETLGNKLWGELRTLAGRPSARKDEDGTIAELVYVVEHPDMVAFQVRADAQFVHNYRTRELSGYRVSVKSGLNPTMVLKPEETGDLLGAFFAGLKAERARRDKEAQERRSRDIANRLSHPDVEPAEAEALLNELAALGQEEKAQALFEAWGEKYSARRAQKESQRENRRLVGLYARALLRWQKEIRLVEETRKEELRKLQHLYDTPFTVFRLTYGVVAMDEDGERFADTQEATVLSDRPGNDGFYTRLERARLIPFRPAHVVSLEREETRAAREGVRVDEQGLVLYVSPYRNAGEVRNSIREMLARLPASPAEPDPFVVAGLEPGAQYDTGWRGAWDTVDRIRENVLDYENQPPWLPEDDAS